MIQNSSTSHLAAHWLVIVNLHSGNGATAKQWPNLREKLATLLPQVTFRMSTQPGAATELLAEALAQGIRHVLAVGGDGTAHQVVNAIMAQKTVKSTEITFALLPCGTGNDWIKTHAIPRRWEAWEAYFRHGKSQQQNLGEITHTTNGQAQKRYFMNVAGLAYDAFVVRALAQQRSKLPAKLLYFWATFRCLFQYTPQLATLAFDGKKVTDHFYTINVGICRYSGGGMQFVPQANPGGECMALTYVSAVSKLAVVLNSYRFYGGRLATYSPATLTEAEAVTITPAPGQEVLLEADGELIGECPATISVVHEALCFIGVGG